MPPRVCHHCTAENASSAYACHRCGYSFIDAPLDETNGERRVLTMASMGRSEAARKIGVAFVAINAVLIVLHNAHKSARGNLRPMNQISVADILELPVQERIQLVEVIWESIAAFPHSIEVSPELKTELEERLADFERNPDAGYSWDQVKAHLKSGSWRTA